MFHIAAAVGNKETFQFISDEMGANINCLHHLAQHHCSVYCRVYIGQMEEVLHLQGIMVFHAITRMEDKGPL